MKNTSYPPNEVIKFDLLGQRKVIFAEDHVVYQTQELYPLGAGPIVSMKSVSQMPYNTIATLRMTKRRQFWALILGVFATVVGGWMGIHQTGVSELVFVGIFTLLLGVIPFCMYLRGRPFLTIESHTAAIVLPADRNKKKIAKVVEGLLRRRPDLLQSH